MGKFPDIKKEVKDFLSEESGIITKESIMKTGLIVGGLLALANSVKADDYTTHTNSLSLSYNGNAAVGHHTHHADHTDGEY